MTRPLVLISVAAANMVVLAGATPVVFTDVTESAGIRFTHTTGAFGAKYMPETFGSGVLWLDVDGDVLVVGRPLAARFKVVVLAALRADENGCAVHCWQRCWQ